MIRIGSTGERCPTCGEIFDGRLHYSVGGSSLCIVGEAPERPGWDDYFLNIAQAVSARADCTRAKHGAVIVKDHRIVATGYNGSPAGGASCLAGRCPRGQLTDEELAHNSADYSNCIALHAEQNAVAYAAERGDTIYITGPPCDMCGKVIAAAGITRVVFPGSVR